MNKLWPFNIFDLWGWRQNGGWGQNRGHILIGNGLMLTLDSVHLERIVWLGGISQKSIVCLLYKLGEHRTCLLYCQISNSRQAYRLIPARCNTGYAATITSTGFCHQFVLLCTPTGSIHIVQNMYLLKTCLLSPKLSSIYQDRLTLYKEHARASIGHQLL